MTHDLKTWIEYFEKVWSGEKSFEVRNNDRDFKVGDFVTLMEYDNKRDVYTGRWIQSRIDYILQGGNFGIESGFVVMTITEKERFPQSPSSEVKEQQGENDKQELLSDWRNGKYPDFSHFSAEEKHDLIFGLVQIMAKETMMMFYACGLNTHIECEVINDPTNEKFKFSFIKLPNN